MRKKIAFIGAGSFVFSRNLIRDILTFPALQDAEIALMDIDAERLGFIKEAAEKIIAKGNYPAKLTVTLDRAEALKDTPKPTGDGDSKTMTLEKLRKMTPQERYNFSVSNPEEYKELYGGKE